MKNLKLFFFSIILIACFLLLSGSIILSNNVDIPNSFAFFVCGGIFAGVGAIGLFINSLLEHKDK